MANYNKQNDAGIYIDPLSDWGWKTLFGSERYKEHLISFINAVYPELNVADITYENVEDMGDTPLSRNARFDLVCTTESGETVMVEVQKAAQKYFFERGLWTTSFKIRDQAQKGEWNYQLKGVYSIGILTFPPEVIEGFHWNDDSFIHTFSIRDDKNYETMTNLLRFAYIAVDKFKKTSSELDNNLEKWVYLLANLRRLDGRPEELKDRIFERFFKAAEIARMPKEQQQNYRRRIMSENDWNNAVNYARELGEKEAKYELARNLLADGIALTQVAKWTGLSESEIASLK